MDKKILALKQIFPFNFFLHCIKIVYNLIQNNIVCSKKYESLRIFLNKLKYQRFQVLSLTKKLIDYIIIPFHVT